MFESFQIIFHICPVSPPTHRVPGKTDTLWNWFLIPRTTGGGPVDVRLLRL